MSERDYLILMVATALMTIAVLTIATLAAAELLPVRRRERSTAPVGATSARRRSGGEDS